MRIRNRLVDLTVLAVFGVCGGMVAEWIRAPAVAEAAPKKAKVVKAQEFRLTDLKGNTRGAFVMGATGQPRLDLYGTDGKIRTSVFLSEEGEHPVVALSDTAAGASPQLQARIVLGTQDAGVPRLYLTDTNGTVRADVGVVDLRPGTDTHGGFLKLYDTLGAEQASLYARGDGASEFTLNDNDPLVPFPTSRVRVFRDSNQKSGIEIHGTTSMMQPEASSAVLAAGPGAGPRLDLSDPSLRNIPLVDYRVAFGFPTGLDDGTYTTSDPVFSPGGYGSNANLFWFRYQPAAGSYDYAFRLLGADSLLPSDLTFSAFRTH